MSAIKHKVRSGLLGLILVLAAAPVHAGSYYSSRGIGMVHYFVSARAQGMGGVGLATPDPLTVNYLNPAGIAGLPLTTINASFFHEATDVSTATQSGSVTDTDPLGFQFVVPVKEGMVAFAIGLSSYSRVEFSNEEQRGGALESVTGEGGVQSASLTVAVRPVRNLYLGASLLFYFGSLRNKWTVDFPPESGLRDTENENALSVSGAKFRFGLIYRIGSAWSLAAVVAPAANLNASRRVTFQNIVEFTDFPDSEVTIPLAIGFGTAVQLGKKVLLGADFYTQRWDEAGLEGFGDRSYRLALGLEFSARGGPFSPYFSRAAYRVGFQYRDLGLEAPAGEKVTEWAATVGIGLPIKWSAARIDLALQAGKRGSPRNLYEETFIRLYGGITLGNKWFQRGRRRP